jgi:putative transposase
LWPHPFGKVGFVDDEFRQQIALWRLGVLGPLMSARLEHGDVRAYLQEAAERLHRMPDGREVTLSARTIESWHYWYQHDGLTGLMPKNRSDKGRTRAVRPEVAELLLRAKAEKPRRSIRRLIKMLVRAKVVQPDELSRSSVHRLLATAGISWRPARAEVRERRSFITECAGDLGVGDSMHGPLVIKPDGTLHKSYLLTQLDCTTRYVLHSYFACGEAAVEQEYGLKQAILRYGPFRAYYVDRGPAYIAHSLRLICGELGIRLLHTGSGDCQAKGVIERWHRTVREELEDELPAAPVSIGDLNSRPTSCALCRWAKIWTRSSFTERLVKSDKTARSGGTEATSKCAPNWSVPRSNCALTPPTLRRYPKSSCTTSSFATPCLWIAWPMPIASAGAFICPSHD